MYKVLYRKWRPKIFDDVIGQEHVTKTLKNEIISGNIAHAYLFVGSRGTGKTSCAKVFSLAVNCKSPVEGNPCGTCEICKEAEKDSLVDVSEIDAASNNGVENIRAIKEESFLVPNMCKYRVYIIDEAHMLSTQAFNAFLKILEEPPKHIIFILATTEPHKIPATILSRCQRFEFHRIDSSEMLERIKYICSEENIKIDDDAIKIITDSADGAMRDALSLLDRCVSSKGRILNVEQVMEVLGITEKDSVKKIYECIEIKAADKALSLIDGLYKESKSIIGICEGLMDVFRGKMVEIISTIGDKNRVNNGKFKELIFALECLIEARRRMTSGNDARLELEITIIKLCLNNGDKEEAKKNGKGSDKSDKKGEGQATAADKGGKALGEEYLNDKLYKFEQWSEVIKSIKESSKSKTLYLAIKDSSAYAKGDLILIDSEKELLFEMLNEPGNKEEVRDAIRNVSGKRYRLGPYRVSKGNKEDLKIENLKMERENLGNVNKEDPEKREKTFDDFTKIANDLGIDIEYKN